MFLITFQISTALPVDGARLEAARPISMSQRHKRKIIDSYYRVSCQAIIVGSIAAASIDVILFSFCIDKLNL